MQSFLRRVRRSNNQPDGGRRYWLYALGEIALVVIGILIAIQINNWNEDRKNQIMARQYTERLLGDLRSDLDEAEEIYVSHLSRIKMILDVLDSFQVSSVKIFLQENQSLVNELRANLSSLDQTEFSSFSQKLNQIHRTRTFEGTDDVYQEMLSSGKFDIIKNVKLKAEIKDYYVGVRERADFQSRLFEARKDYHNALIVNGISNLDRQSKDEIDATLVDGDGLITTLENYLNLSRRTLAVLYFQDQSIKSTAEHLIKSIEAYLE